MFAGSRRHSLAAPLAKFAVLKMMSILNQSLPQLADDRVLELVQSLTRPKRLLIRLKQSQFQV